MSLLCNHACRVYKERGKIIKARSGQRPDVFRFKSFHSIKTVFSRLLSRLRNIFSAQSTRIFEGERFRSKDYAFRHYSPIPPKTLCLLSRKSLPDFIVKSSLQGERSSLDGN